MFTICAFYKFFANAHLEDQQQELLNFMTEHAITGTILLANEGINSTVAGSQDSIEALLCLLRSWPNLDDLQAKFSYAQKMPFAKTKVKIKSEIVTLKAPEINPAERTGQHIAPAQWNELISQPDVLLIDTRNDYEYECGTFVGALNPDTENFSDFKHYVRTELQDVKNRPVAMFCTGGIRCEKASAFMLAEGFEKVYQLEGGILKYLEDVQEKDSLWQKQCYVFDERRAVDHKLQPSE